MVDLVYRLGSEFLVNTQTPGIQSQSTITSLSNGGFVVSWQDAGGALGDVSIKAQMYDAGGAKVGSEFVVNTEDLGSQDRPTITGLTGGGFVVSWTDASGTLGDESGTSVKAQIFDATGAKSGSEFLVNTATLNNQAQATITGLSSGGLLVSWKDDGILGDAFGPSIKAQIFDATGAKLGSEFVVNSQLFNDRGAPTVTDLSNGGFIVSWSDRHNQLGDNSPFSVSAQIFDAAGAKVGSEFLVNTTTSGSQERSAITALSDGRFVVTWQDLGGTLGDSSSNAIKAQIFDATGVKIGSEFLVNTETFSTQNEVAISRLPDGGFVVSWNDFSGTLGDASSNSIKAQVFDSTGAKVGSEFLVNTVTANTQIQSAITVLPNGNFVVSWEDYSTSTIAGGTNGNIKAQIFSLEPPQNAAPVANGDALTAVLEDSGSRVITAAELLANDSAGPGYESGQTLTIASVSGAVGGTAVLNANGSVTFTPAPNFNGPASFSYTVQDNGGTANGGSDTSGPATVTFNVTPLNDAPVVTGETAAVDEDQSITIDVLANDSDLDLDSLTITSATAAFGTVSIVDVDGKKYLYYTASADSFDTLASGATAPDTITYTVSDGVSSVQGVVNLTVTGLNDSVSIAGTNQADIINGLAVGGIERDETIEGLNGDDVLDGKGGADRLIGGNGSDTLLGSGGFDELYGDRGDDKLDGGLGLDYLEGSQGNDTMTGGADADTFFFAKAGGSDVILDFEVGLDRLSLDIGLSIKSKTLVDTDNNGLMDSTLVQFSSGSVLLKNVLQDGWALL